MATVLEICASSLSSAVAAQAGGASRIELCTSLDVGGLTPSSGLIKAVLSRVHLPVYALIRPRAGNFVYNTEELEIMHNDIDVAGHLGCAGVVVGVLTVTHQVDVASLSTLVLCAKRWGMGVAFHRAFDDISFDDMELGLEDVITAGCDRILTSGGHERCTDSGAIAKLGWLRAAARERITVMPGAGLNAQNVTTVVNATKVTEVHASCKHVIKVEAIHKSRFGIDMCYETDVMEVTRMVEALKAAPGEVRS